MTDKGKLNSKMELQLNKQEQIDCDLDMSEMVQEIKDGQPNHTDIGWLQIFPEAKSVFGKFIRLRLKVRRERLKIEYNIAEEEIKDRLKKNPPESKWMDSLIVEGGQKRLQSIKKQISAINHQLTFLTTIGQKPEKIKAREKKIIITEEMIQRAKEYPLGQLIEINRQGFTRCYMHNDKHASAYTKKNFLHCFSCNYSADTIKILMDRDGLTFKESVLKLQ